MKLTFLFTFLIVAFCDTLMINQEEIITHVNNVQRNWVARKNKYFQGKTFLEVKLTMGSL